MSLARTWKQFKSLTGISIQETIAYRASAAIWLLSDVTVTLTMPYVLMAAAQGGQIAGFAAGDFVLYYLVMLVVSSFTSSHIMWEIATEIREGIFSAHIVRPVDYLVFTIARNAGWRIIRTAILIPVLVLLILLFARHLEGAQLHLTLPFFLSLLLGHFVSVCFVTMFAMVALFTQEAEAIFNVYYLPMIFLSGQMIPIALFPEWARSLAHLTPFYLSLIHI